MLGGMDGFVKHVQYDSQQRWRDPLRMYDITAESRPLLQSSGSAIEAFYHTAMAESDWGYAWRQACTGRSGYVG